MNPRLSFIFDFLNVAYIIIGEDVTNHAYTIIDKDHTFTKNSLKTRSLEVKLKLHVNLFRT